MTKNKIENLDDKYNEYLKTNSIGDDTYQDSMIANKCIQLAESNQIGKSFVGVDIKYNSINDSGCYGIYGDFEEADDNIFSCNYGQNDVSSAFKIYEDKKDKEEEEELAYIKTLNDRFEELEKEKDNNDKNLKNVNKYKNKTICNFDSPVFLSANQVKNIYKQLENHEELKSISDMFENKKLVISNIDGSKQYNSGLIQNIDFDGINTFSCKLLQSFIVNETSTKNTGILNKLKKVISTSIAKTKLENQ